MQIPLKRTGPDNFSENAVWLITLVDPKREVSNVSTALLSS